MKYCLIDWLKKKNFKCIVHIFVAYLPSSHSLIRGYLLFSSLCIQSYLTNPQIISIRWLHIHYVIYLFIFTIIFKQKKSFTDQNLWKESSKLYSKNMFKKTKQNIYSFPKCWVSNTYHFQMRCNPVSRRQECAISLQCWLIWRCAPLHILTNYIWIVMCRIFVLRWRPVTDVSALLKWLKVHFQQFVKFHLSYVDTMDSYTPSGKSIQWSVRNIKMFYPSCKLHNWLKRQRQIIKIRLLNVEFKIRCMDQPCHSEQVSFFIC